VGAQYSDADRIKDLRGGFKTGGGGVTYESVDLSGGFSWGQDKYHPCKTVHVFDLGAGQSFNPLPVEAHGGISYTQAASFNIPHTAKKVGKWFKKTF
jgi:hypothetical protein